MSTIVGERRSVRAKPEGGVAQVARELYVLVAWLVVVGIVGQVFLAGLGLLVDGEQIGLHRGFGYLFFPLAWLLLATGLAARLPGRTLALTALLIPLLIAQYVLVYLPADGGLAALRVLHPVNALALFWLALHLARAARSRTGDAARGEGRVTWGGGQIP